MKPYVPTRTPIVDSNGMVTREWALLFEKVAKLVVSLRVDGTVQPVSLADADAENNSIYYSTDQSKLVYKDASATVNDLY